VRYISGFGNSPGAEVVALGARGPDESLAIGPADAIGCPVGIEAPASQASSGSALFGGGHRSPSNPPRVRVTVLSEIRFYRDALAGALDRDERITVVSCAGALSDARGEAGQELGDVVLLQVIAQKHLHDIMSIVQAQPNSTVLVLGLTESEHLVRSCARAGATGYLSPDASLGDLVNAVEKAHRGEAVFPPQMVATLLRNSVLGKGDPERQPRLTARELEVVAHGPHPTLALTPS
jgi:two-component system nitrate/nitrite response regulator NarL